MDFPPKKIDSSPKQILQRYFGYDSFRGPQETIIEHLLAGKHALVIMPTGMGKSLCFQIPALMFEELTLVVSPLIALMKDQVDTLRRRSIDAVFINSSLSRQERELRYQKIKEGAYDLVYVTPERFRKEEFREVLSARKVAMLAIDEAHCISEWGHDFRPDYSRLGEFRQQLGNPLTLAVTATATPEVQEDIRTQLDLTTDSMTMFHEGIDRPNLRLEVEEVWDEDDKLEHIESILDQHPGSGIIYFTLIKTLDRFSELLSARKRDHVCYHGKLEKRARKQLQNTFMSGETELVLATNAFGMGIDKEDIRFVIHAELPGSMESYYQEIGRAGRDGKDSVCVLLYANEDLMTQMQFLEWSHPKAEDYFRLHAILSEDQEKLKAYGFEWLQKQFHARGRHDHRLETALGMLDRHNVIKGELEPFDIEVIAELPEILTNEQRLAEKHKRGQQKLYTLVQYTKVEGSRKDFIHQYFGLEVTADSQ